MFYHEYTTTDKIRTPNSGSTRQMFYHEYTRTDKIRTPGSESTGSEDISLVLPLPGVLILSVVV